MRTLIKYANGFAEHTEDSDSKLYILDGEKAKLIAKGKMEITKNRIVMQTNYWPVSKVAVYVITDEGELIAKPITAAWTVNVFLKNRIA